ncbi:Uncharacterised protein [Raoultella planticola]|nr:Uncharacterised protein [Raoultella planticola]
MTSQVATQPAPSIRLLFSALMLVMLLSGPGSDHCVDGATHDCW